MSRIKVDRRGCDAAAPQGECVKETPANSSHAEFAQTPLEAHPLADIFPLLDEPELGELAADIAEHGQREPIVTYEDRVLDGRNRLRACLMAGVKPWFKPFDGVDPLAFVVSANLRRRHLNESQRAMIAARLATLRLGANQHSEGLPIGRASTLLNIGERSVARAREVLESGEPELARAVDAGELSVSGAVEQIRRGIVTGVAMSPHAERGLDLYETPPEAVRALLSVESFTGPIWEPACGPGAIVRVLRDAGHLVIATDLVEYGCPDSTARVDFLLEQRAPEGVTAIVTNPPFMHADAFVRKALALVPRVTMLLRLAFVEGQGRADIINGDTLACVYPFRNRLAMMHRDGWQGPQASSAIAMAWFTWIRGHHGPIALRPISWEPPAAPEAFAKGAPPPPDEPHADPEPPAEPEPEPPADPEDEPRHTDPPAPAPKRKRRAHRAIEEGGAP
jgi:hypothetical protein